jgi:hypothetical protein
LLLNRRLPFAPPVLKLSISSSRSSDGRCIVSLSMHRFVICQ